MGYQSYWGRYVPVAEKRAKALKKTAELKKKGKDIQPVEDVGRNIADSFWGRGWCEHLESFSDFENRLPRGRTYVRNGSVCHLEVQPGRINAMVAGSELYNVDIEIAPLNKKDWTAIKKKCSGRIGSVLELLQGRLSKEVMAIVVDRENGLFPKPGEMELDCSCPDWAEMCKHVAAVLYGVGNRLDTRPELLFVLRGVDVQELISAKIALQETAATDAVIAEDMIGGIFGVDIDTDTTAKVKPPAKAGAGKKRTAERAGAAGKRKKKAVSTRKKTAKVKATPKSKTAERKQPAKAGIKTRSGSRKADAATKRKKPLGSIAASRPRKKKKK